MNKHIKKAISVHALCVMILILSSCDRIEKSIVNEDVVRASVIEIEKYGHAVLDITAAEFIDFGYELGDIVCVRFGSFEEDMPFLMGIIQTPVQLCSAE